jgi:hypothetical protein
VCGLRRYLSIYYSLGEQIAAQLPDAQQQGDAKRIRSQHSPTVVATIGLPGV